jgi:tRNA modification GTPase
LTVLETMSEAIFAVVELTPPGRGAIATILAEGAGAAAAVAAHFRGTSGRSPASIPTDRPVHGLFGREPGEQVVVRRRGAESVEIHCHGGPAVVAMIRGMLLAAGGEAVDWRAWAGNREADPIAAWARIALAEARTERVAAILLDQYHGSLRRALDEIERDLAAGDRGAARRKIDVLQTRATLGRHLVEPWSVVLAGPPNAGKSSLLNALAGYRRARVHHAPGTTRDVVALRTALGGWPVELCDTAGLHAGGDAVERAGIERAEATLRAADLVLLVFDRSVAWSPPDEELRRRRPDAMIVHNKCDLPEYATPRPGGLAVSALRGDGIEALAAAIADRLVPEPPRPGDAVPFAAEHQRWLDDLEQSGFPLARE